MAVTINNFVGFETGGLEELSADNGFSSNVASPSRSGGRALEISNGSGLCEVDFVVASAGSGYVVGIAIQDSLGAASSARTFMAFRDTGSGTLIDVGFDGSGNIIVRDSTGATVITDSATTISANTWYYFELYFENLASGAAELFIDDVSVGSTTAKDFNTGTPPDHLQFTEWNGTSRFDDIYIMSGATAASDRLGPVEVFAYQGDSGSTTAGSALDVGTWANTGETPLDTTNHAQFDTNNANGSVDTDGSGSRVGPSGDSNIDGATNIKAAKWVFSARRTTGSNSSPFLRYGDSGGTTDSPGNILTTSDAIYSFLSETTNVPSDSQHFRLGMGKGSGGRDVRVNEAWGMLLHVPGSGALALTPTGLASSLAFGTATVAPGAVDLAPNGLASALAIGTAAVTTQTDLTATGLPSALALGTPVVAPGAVDLAPAGLASGLVIGSATLAPGAVDLAPGGLSSALAIGMAVLTTQTDLAPAGLAPTLSIGTATLAPGAVDLAPAGLAPALVIGTAAVSQDAIELTPAGLPSALVIGEASVDPGAVDLAPAGLASGLLIGTAAVAPGAVDLAPAGLASALAIGSAAVAPGAVDLAPSGLASAFQVGTAIVSSGALILQPSGLASALVFGTPNVAPGAVDLAPAGLASSLAIGSAAVAPGAVDLAPQALASGLQFGTPQLFLAQDLQPAGLASTLAIGAAAVTPGAALLSALGLPSGLAFGTHLLATGAVDLQPAGLASALAFGQAVVLDLSLPAYANLVIADAAATGLVIADLAATGLTLADLATTNIILCDREC